MGSLASLPGDPSPSLEEIKARQDIEIAAVRARQDAEVAAARVRQDAEVAAERVQQDAEVAAERARQDAARAQIYKVTMMVQTVQEQAKRDAQAAQEQAKKLQEAADEGKRKATAAQEVANAWKKVAEEQVKAANAAKEGAERKLKEGIRPVVTPTPEEVSAAKQKVQYRDDLFHIAVAGMEGGGKSSLINAFRGLRDKDIGSAVTGIIERTLVMARYPHPNAEYPLVLYDFPGAGTLKIPDWQYFNTHGLYVFDSIIILFDNRFTMVDIDILTNCRRFKIPAYIVRSKADQHICNIMKDMGYDSDDDESEDQRKKLYQAARQQFIQQTHQSLKGNLENANIPDQRVYIVSNKTMLDVVKGNRPKKVIDEIELLNDLIGEAQTRRARRDAEAATIMNLTDLFGHKRQAWPALSPPLEEIKRRRDAEAAAEQARKDAEAARAQIAELIKSNQESRERAMAAGR
ncbi:interferon-inducible GTPase-domain-containing protein [Suillus discolor]|uniref:Interferon-inducible GTPase-domain-containing protein n=1 Tax=Suillus discolor TaxID=1912936 RepID=A0A9P7F476_9AGAM|nr:interferon-inducible GTPase-domain-containing protein [Suillus discolor]KAG2105086.1 interferon-inducible GTPase-domain-containing protein [Suillus discolor]